MGRDIESGIVDSTTSLPFDEKDVTAPATTQKNFSFQSMLDSFKKESRHEHDGQTAAERTASSPLVKTLQARHLEMIAIGGCIGTGLFVSSGSALSSGGPASLLIAFAVIGGLLFVTMHALGELAVLFPVAGAYTAYSSRFIDPAWGFAMGWNYALQWLVTLPLELIALSMTFEYWNAPVPHWAWVLIFLVLIIIINLLSVREYGEVETVLSVIKIVAVVGFIILGIILNCGGGPNHEYIGGSYWHDPGAFNYGWQGFFSVLVTAAFSFSGAEMIGLASAESEKPEEAVPKAIKHVFWRVFVVRFFLGLCKKSSLTSFKFYIASITLIGLLVPYTDDRLLTAGSAGVNIKASPFVIAIEDAGIAVLPSIINAIILITVLSVANSSVYGSTRTLIALAEQDQAPRIFAYIDRKGRPLLSLALTFAFGLLAFMADSSKEATAFTWLLALSGLSSIITWGSICFAHIRFRSAWKIQNFTLKQLPFRSPYGVWGSWIGFVGCVIVLILQLVISVLPEGYEDMSASDRASDFWSAYLAVPLTIACFFGFKIYSPTPFLTVETMDLITGVKIADPDAVKEPSSKPRFWKKIYRFFC
ncbi:MAG: glyceraldehyde-3-phosphate dehydrogenase 1 [Cirrosporium novae-zelandiae]|nr:MAG: glyceraldehyde-3-phosphate dehydrogenase 1 [Cirrosporium novae-zelandiae]